MGLQNGRRDACRAGQRRFIILGLTLQPITYREACIFIDENHRHHNAPQGHKFSIAVSDGEKVVGVVTVGRPVARYSDNGWTLEVTRCCTDGTKNACSMLYSAAWRAARAMGYKRLITYTSLEENGASLRSANWKLVGETKGAGYWDSRPRNVVYPKGQKLLWEAQK